MDKSLTVGIADMKFTRVSGVLITYALGSCIGICLYDPGIKLGALVHIMLPVNTDAKGGNAFKYADTGISETVGKMEKFGALRSRMICKIAGGAKMFDIQDGATFGNIGQRNIESVKAVLRNEKIRLVREDVGANYARTLSFDVSNGEGRIRTYGRAEIIF